MPINTGGSYNGQDDEDDGPSGSPSSSPAASGSGTGRGPSTSGTGGGPSTSGGGYGGNTSGTSNGGYQGGGIMGGGSFSGGYGGNDFSGGGGTDSFGGGNYNNDGDFGGSGNNFSGGGGTNSFGGQQGFDPLGGGWQSGSANAATGPGGYTDDPRDFAMGHIFNQIGYGGGFGMPTSGSFSDPYNAAPGEQDLMARTMLAESRGIRNPDGTINRDALEGVGSVIHNRMTSGKFPNTVSGVINQPKQFSVVGDGAINRITTDTPGYAQAYELAGGILGGQIPSSVGDSLNFANMDTVNNKRGYSSSSSKSAFNGMQPQQVYADANNPNISHTFGTIGGSQPVAAPQPQQFAGGQPIDPTQANEIPNPMGFNPGQPIGPQQSAPPNPTYPQSIPQPQEMAINDFSGSAGTDRLWSADQASTPGTGGIMGDSYSLPGDSVRPVMPQNLQPSAPDQIPHASVPSQMAQALNDPARPYQSGDPGGQRIARALGYKPPSTKKKAADDKKKKRDSIMNWNVTYSPLHRRMA